MSYDLKLERLIDARAQQVFDAFIDADAMKEWYLDHPGWIVEVLACDARVGGTTSVAFGPGDERYREDMTYREFDRPHRLVYAATFWMPDGSSFDTVVTITFDVQDGKTLLTLVQTGFPNAEQRDAHRGGWPGFIDRLERVVAARAS